MNIFWNVMQNRYFLFWYTEYLNYKTSLRLNLLSELYSKSNAHNLRAWNLSLCFPFPSVLLTLMVIEQIKTASKAIRFHYNEIWFNIVYTCIWVNKIIDRTKLRKQTLPVLKKDCSCCFIHEQFYYIEKVVCAQYIFGHMDSWAKWSAFVVHCLFSFYNILSSFNFTIHVSSIVFFLINTTVLQ